MEVCSDTAYFSVLHSDCLGTLVGRSNLIVLTIFELLGVNLFEPTSHEANFTKFYIMCMINKLADLSLRKGTIAYLRKPHVDHE